MSSDIRVSLVVLNWNGRRFLEPCLSSLFGQTFLDFEIVLVDNGSNDGSIEFLETYFAPYLTPDSRPFLKLVKLNHNTGFAGGNLAGLAACNLVSCYIATLNNDTIAAPDWLEKLVTALAETAASSVITKWAAACGPMLFASSQSDGVPTIAAAGIEVYRNGLAMDGKVGQPLDERETATREIFGPCAGAAVYDRRALNEVGFFDPAFFAYLEDADLAWRLRLAGWRTLYVPQAQVWHEYSGTSGQNSPFKNFQLGRNRVWTILKNMPGRLLLRHLPAILLYDFAASLYTLRQGNRNAALGRLAALKPKDLRRVWQQRRQIQKQRTANLTEIEAWLLPNPPLLGNVRLRQKVNKLAKMG